jgi:hypothetical protein
MNPVRLPNKPDLLQTKVSARSIQGMQGSGSGSAVPSLSWQNRPGFPRAPDLAVLDPIAGLQNEQDIGGDHANHDKHPVLDLEAQNGEMLDQKLHRFRPLFGQDKRFDGRNILFLYFQKIPADSLCRPSSGVAVLSRHRPAPPVHRKHRKFTVARGVQAVCRTRKGNTECRRGP